MSDVVGEIKYLASIDTSSYKKGIKEIEGANSDLAVSANKADGDVNNSFSRMGAGAIRVGKLVAKGLLVATTAVVGLVSASVKSYADYEQLVGGVDTLFKESSKTLQAYASEAYKTAGISANQYMAQATSFSATLLQGLGGDTAKATEYANKAIIDMSDNANKMGTDIGLIQNAYQGFAKDNYMMLDNLKLGYGGTAGEMARLVNESGVMGSAFQATAENVKDIPFDQLIEAIHKVQSNLGITGTTAKEASSTISGSFNSMKSSWSDLMTTMTNPAGDMSKALTNFLESVNTFGKNLMPAITTALTGVVGLIDGILTTLIAQLPILLATLLPKVITTFISLITSIALMLPTLMPIVTSGFFQLLTALLTAIPLIIPPLIEAIISLITTFVEQLSNPDFLTSLLNAAVALFLGIVQAIPKIVIALVEALPTIIDNILTFLLDPENLKMLIKASVDLFMALVMAVPQILGALFTAFGTLIGNLWTKLKTYFTEFAGNFGDAIGGIFKNAINGVLGFLEGFINKPIDLINDAIKVINKVPGVNIGLIGRVTLPRLAEGGIVMGPTMAMVGEGGEPEAVIPLSKLDSILNNEGGGKYEYNIGTINIGTEVDGDRWLKRLTRNQEITSKGLVPETRYA